jgi:hypothetical protein
MTPDVPYDLLYATTDKGFELPIIDVTHPAFALSHTPEELDEIYEKHVIEFRSRPDIPPEALEHFRASVIGRAFIASARGVLEAIPTYYLKVGGHNLAPNAHPVDKAIIGSTAATFVRLRLQDMARLLADGLKPLLAVQSAAPILFVCIAGGAAADTWNALLYLKQESADLLEGRSVSVRVLDMDPVAPAFGAQAIAALTAAGQPLANLPISWEYLPYNWAQAADLSSHLDSFRAKECACAISSEGGLFEYGSDEEIVANLRAIRDSAGEGSVVVGSVTRDCESVRRSLAMGGMAIRPRALEDFLALAETAGWKPEAILERPTNFNLRLGKG